MGSLILNSQYGMMTYKTYYHCALDLRQRVRLTAGFVGMEMKRDHGGRRETKLWTHLRPLDRT